MPLICQNCGAENDDTGGDPSRMRCGNCGRGPLVRESNKGADAGGMIGAGIGAAIGAGVAGPVGAVVGALIGFLAGNTKETRR
jgi:hypothetical protein